MGVRISPGTPIFLLPSPSGPRHRSYKPTSSQVRILPGVPVSVWRHSVVRITRATAPKPERLHTGARSGPSMQVRSSPRGAVRDGGKQDGWEWSERMGRGQRRRPMGRNPDHSRKPAYCAGVTDGHLVRCRRQRADGNDTDDGPRLSGEAQNPESWSGSPAGRKTGGVSYCVLQKGMQRLDRHVAVGFSEIAQRRASAPQAEGAGSTPAPRTVKSKDRSCDERKWSKSPRRGRMEIFLRPQAKGDC